MVGRATSPSGPFFDATGKPMLSGGHTELMVKTGNVIGPGGASVYAELDRDIIVYHYYDGGNGGTPRLAVNNLNWTSDGWPFVV